MAQKKNSQAPDYSGQQFNNVSTPRLPALPGSFSNSSGGWGGPGDMQQSYDARVQRLRDQTPEQLTQQANQFQQRQQHNARTPEQRGQIFDRQWDQYQGDQMLRQSEQQPQQPQVGYLPELGTGDLPHEQQQPMQAPPQPYNHQREMMMSKARQRRDNEANRKLPLAQQKMPPGGHFIDPSQQG